MDSGGKAEKLKEIVAQGVPVSTTERLAIDPWADYGRTLKDAYRAGASRRYVVTGIIERPSLVVVYSPPGGLKSMLVASVAVDVAAGRPWLEPLPGTEGSGFPVTQGPVIWLDFDNGRQRTDERFGALARARQAPEDIPLTYYVMPSPWFDASEARAVDALLDRVIRERAALLVIDNLGVVCGSADENSPEIGHAMSNLRRIAEFGETAVIVIHHQRKSVGVSARAGDSLRGHSSIEAALDLALLIEREEGADTVRVRPTKQRGAPLLPFGARFTYRHKNGTDELEQARFCAIALEDTTSDHAIEAAVVGALEESRPQTKGRLTATVKMVLPKMAVNRIRHVIDLQVASGKIKETVGGRGAKLLDLG